MNRRRPVRAKANASRSGQEVDNEFTNFSANVLAAFDNTATPTQTKPKPKPRKPQSLAALSDVVSSWDDTLDELTQAIFTVNATVTVENLPYYEELPASASALEAPTGRLSHGTKVSLMYPQFATGHSMIYMRLKLCDPRCGELSLYYLPIANQTLSDQELATVFGHTNVDATQYVDWFFTPGLPDPAPADDDPDG